jgi:hypothetical protein
VLRLRVGKLDVKTNLHSHQPRGLEHGNLRLHFHGKVSAFYAGFWKVMNCTQDFLSFVMTTFHWPIALKNSNFWQSSNRKVAF